VRATIHRMILDGLIDAESIITPILKFSDRLVAEYDQISSTPEKNIKLGVEY
jgi:hypothetical protein